MFSCWSYNVQGILQSSDHYCNIDVLYLSSCYFVGLQVCILWCSITTWELTWILATADSREYNDVLLVIVVSSGLIPFKNWFVILFVKVLLKNMVYADDDEALLDADVSPPGLILNIIIIILNSDHQNWLQEDGSLPDRDQVSFHISQVNVFVFCSEVINVFFLTFLNYLRGCRIWNLVFIHRAFMDLKTTLKMMY